MSVEKAVSFAASMIRKGEYVGKAIPIAAGYYKVTYEEVQKGLAARAGKSRAGQKQKPKPVVQCGYCCEAEATHKMTGYAGYTKVWTFYLCDKCVGTAEGIVPSRLSKVTTTKYIPSKEAG